MQAHLLSQVDYYLLSQVVTVTIGVLRVVGALFMIASFIYLVWLSYAYALFSRGSLLVLLLLLLTNFEVYHYGGWGVFEYAQRILVSVLLLHALLFLNKTSLNLSRRDLVLLLIGFCLLTVGYAANTLPIVVLVATAYWCRPSNGRDGVPPPPSAARRNALILLGSAISVSLITLTYFTHGEFASPRNEILWMYFPTSDYPQTAIGLLAFLGERMGSFLYSTFRILPPVSEVYLFTAFGILPTVSDNVTMAIAVAFGIGLVRSLFESRRDSRRFVTGVYVLLVLVCLAGLGATGVYAFGDIRYALFMHGPLLVVAAYGITDIGRWIGAAGYATVGRFLPRSVVDGARAVGLAVLIVLALAASAATAGRVRTLKADSSREFGEIVQLIEADRSPLVVYDAFAQLNLEAIGIDFPNKRTFLFDFPFLAGGPDLVMDLDEYRTFLEAEEDILWITYSYVPQPQLANYRAEIEQAHFKASQVILGPWEIVNWESCVANSMEAPLQSGPAEPASVLTQDQAGQLILAYWEALGGNTNETETVVDASQLPESKAGLKAAILTVLETRSTTTVPRRGRVSGCSSGCSPASRWGSATPRWPWTVRPRTAGRGETSWHRSARPSRQSWQTRVFDPTRLQGMAIFWTYWPQQKLRSNGVHSTIRSTDLQSLAKRSGQNIGTRPMYCDDSIRPPRSSNHRSS